MTSERENLLVSDIYDHHPNGIGENPGHQVPVQTDFSAPGNGQLNDALRAAGLGPRIKELQERGRHVFAKRLPGKVTLYVASAAAIGVVAGAYYLRKKRSRNQ